MEVKVLMTWSIKPGREQEYFGFVVGEFLPKANKMGLDLTDAWVTVFGDHPQILVGALLPRAEDAQKLVESEGWETLTNQLKEYVDDFGYKIVRPSGAFQF